MKCERWRSSFGLLVLWLPIVVNGLREINLLRSCGSSFNRDAGSIRFTGQSVPGHSFVDRCNLNISGYLGSSDEMFIMFYFDKFDLPHSCTVSNLRLRNRDGGFVQGLGKQLCGHNRTLKEDGQFFYTSSDLLVLSLWHEDLYVRWNVNGEFVLKFIAFHKGACNDFEHRCSNGHCIRKINTCFEDLKYCGSDSGNSDCTEEEDDDVTSEETVQTILKQFGWIIAVVLSSVFIAIVLKCRNIICRNLRRATECGVRESRRSSTENSLRELEEQERAANRPIQVRARRHSGGSDRLMVDLDHEPRRIAGIFQNGNTHADIHDGSETQNDVINTNASATTNNGALPSAPPPSYNEAMAPSYDEVMSNIDKYSVK